MNALILAAGFGTRLKPWTDKHPKALVPVGGIPMLKRVIMRLKEEGFDNIAVNTHHFSDQIKDYLKNNDFGINIEISDETDGILDTGGGLLKASELFDNNQPILVHNVDILSDAPLSRLLALHAKAGHEVSLITSDRDSSRKLVFDDNGMLKGWHNIKSNEYKPAGFKSQSKYHESGFSGIYIVSPETINCLRDFSYDIESKAFPIMDFFLSKMHKIKIGEIKLDKLNLIDIGKPETLSQANAIFGL